MADFKSGVDHRHLHARAAGTAGQRLLHAQVLAGHADVFSERRLAGVAQRPLVAEQRIRASRPGASPEARAGGGNTAPVVQKNRLIVDRAAIVVGDQVRVLFVDRQDHERKVVVAATHQFVEWNPDRVEEP